MATTSSDFTDEQKDMLTSIQSKMATEEKLRSVWASVLGMPLSEILIDRNMLDFADSLSIMKVSALIKKEMGLEFSSQRIYERRTIKAQASSLVWNPSSVSFRGVAGAPKAPQLNSPRSEHPRSSPPHVFYGMAHLYYCMDGLDDIDKRRKVNDGFRETKAATSGALRRYGLSWADVEDVLPMTNTSSHMLENKTRAQSWVLRMAFTTSKTSAQVLEALKAVLQNHPVLRAIAVRYLGKPLHVVVRSSPQWFKYLVVTENDVDNPGALKTLLQSDYRINLAPYAMEGGPLFRAIISNVRSTGTAGLIIIASHTCLDAISLSLFLEDIATYLAVGSDALKSHSSYKLYACNYEKYRDRIVSSDNCRYFSKLLQGISEHSDASWPPQTNPEMNFFRGTSYPWWKDAQGYIRYPSERNVIENGDNEHGVEGISCSIKLPYLKGLRAAYGISAPVLLKAAVVLFNIYQTGAKEAHFILADAGRSWPFSQGYDESESMQVSNLHPIDINGPTCEFVVDRVCVNKEYETVEDFLERLQEAQADISLHAHAPMDSVLSLLSKDDQLAVEKIASRQMLNWYPDLLKRNFGPATQPAMLRRIQLHNNIPGGYGWNAAMSGPETIILNATYDDAHYHSTDVRGWIAMTLSAVEWLCDPRNWAADISACEFTSENVCSWE